MKNIEFEWDNKKNTTNLKKHSVSFEEAKTAFYDEHAIQFFDPDHSKEEDRFLLLGLSLKMRAVVVCHCYRKEETTIRIISVRKANKKEEKYYWSKRR